MPSTAPIAEMEPDTLPDAPTASSSVIERPLTAPRQDAWFILGTAAVTIVIAVMRLIWNPRFYFADDTQTGSLGIWREVGEMVLTGHWRMLDPHALTAGNYFAEGQWALLNPLQWLIGIGAATFDDLLAYTTVLKIAFLVGMAIGVFLLARSYGASAWWASVAGVLAPAAGFTVYMDSTSWVTGLFDSALVVWAWWGLRRIEGRRSPLPYLIATYLLVTFGYVFGPVMLAGILVISLVVAAFRRAWRVVRDLLLASVFGGLLTVAVFLPGMLTASATVRSNFTVRQYWFLSADLTDFGGLISPTAQPAIDSFSGGVTPVPLLYVAWVLPLLVMVWPSVRASAASLLVPFLTMSLAAALVLGPSDVGPMRWPARFMPYVAVGLLIVLAVAATRGYPRDLTRRRLVTALVVTLAMAFLVWTQTPLQRMMWIMAALTGAALVALHVIAHHERILSSRRTPLAVAVIGAVTVAIVPVQMHYASAAIMATVAMPDRASDLRTVLPDGVDDAFIVGATDVTWLDSPAAFSEALIANLWYYSATSTSNTYSVMRSPAFRDDLCTDNRGQTCREAYDTLLSIDPTTDTEVATLLGVNTIMLMRTPGEPVPEVPPGWSLLAQGEWTWTIVRDEPVARAGGISAAGAGTEVTLLTQTDTTIEFQVDAVGTDPTVTLSRVAWPGYTVHGAEMAAPVRGYMLSIDVSGASPGDTVTVRFRPPGWAVEVVAFTTSLLILVAWPIGDVVVRRRRSTAQG